MNIINMTPPNDVRLTAEETQLLDLLHVCGLGIALDNAHQIDPILVYLQHGEEPKHGFAYSLGYPYYSAMKRGLRHSAWRNLSRGDACSLMWLYRTMPYDTMLKLVRAKLIGEYNEPTFNPSVYDANHPRFAANEVKWAKYCTMLALEGFPLKLSYDLSNAVFWLSSYEILQDRFADHPLLPKMRQSLLRLSNRGHHDLFDCDGMNFRKMKPRTAGARKYMSLKGLDQLAMMRHHVFASQSN